MPRWYRLAAAFFILQTIQAPSFVDRQLYGEWLGKGGDKLTESLNLLMIGTCLLLFFTNLSRIRAIRNGAMFAFGLSALFFSSVAWSIDPATSMREAIQYLFVVLGVLGLAANLKASEFMSLLAWMCFLSAVTSLALIVASPSSVTSDTGDFRGIFPQKNVLGEAMTVGALASLHGLRSGKRRRLANAVFLAVISITAVKSQSATSCLTIFAFGIISAVSVLIRKGGASRAVAIGLAIIALPALMAALVFQDELLELIGKDPSLTGRTDIWRFAILYIYQRPWLGWGYFAFWTVNNPAAQEIAQELHWFAPQAHNGLLEMLLHVGVIGSSFIIFVWARTILMSIRCMQTAEKEAAISCMLSCAGVILVGISETVLLAPYEASTSVFLITGLLCEKAIRMQGQPQRPSAHRNVAGAVPVRYTVDARTRASLGDFESG